MSASFAATTPWLARVRQRAFRHAPDDGAAVVLGHARIYILPTRRGLAVMATLFTMLVTSLNYAVSLGFVVTFLLTGLIAAALLATFRNLAGIEVRPVAAAETFAGASMTFTLALAGRSADRASIVVRAAGCEPGPVDVAAGAHVQIGLEIPAPHRGPVPLGRVTLTSAFPLGLWRGWAYVHFPLSGIAYPAPESGAPPVPPSPLGADGDGGAGADDEDLAGLREYQVGDPLQRVAWKAVARGGGWFTKSFEGSRGGGPVVLDFHAMPAGMPLEARLSRLCAWVLACERAMRPYALRIPGISLPAGHGRDHRHAALTALALFDAPSP